MSINRRKFLKTCASVGSIPYWLSPKSFAQIASSGEAPAPLRFISLFSPHGTVRRRWKPRPVAQANQASDFDISYEGCILAPLAPYKDALMILDGVDYRVLYDNNATGHEGGMVTAVTGSPMIDNRPQASATAHGSIDQYIASHICSDCRLPSLELAIGQAGGSSVYNTFNYGPGGVALPSQNDPVAVVERLLSALGQAAADAAQVAKRQIMLDFLRRDLERLRRKTVGKGLEILDTHLASLDSFASSMRQSSGGTSQCSAENFVASTGFTAGEFTPEITRRQIDLMVEALYCDMTRVASLRLQHAGSGDAMPFIGLNMDIHNDIAHAVPSREDMQSTSLTAAEENMVAVQSWYSSQVAYLLQALQSRPEGNGTMLDNTVILWVNELGNAAIHGNLNVPMMVMGGAGGRLNMGQWLRLSQDQEPDCTNFFAIDRCPGEEPSSRQTAHNHVLVAILRAFGIMDQSFGDPRYQGPLEGMLAES